MKQQSTTDVTPRRAQQMGLSRREYVEMLRQRYVAGTLDEMLMTVDGVPDTLLCDLFPHLFPREPAQS